ncbi:MAG: DUF2796 domain-containing protein [Filomicrobium sp.]
MARSIAGLRTTVSLLAITTFGVVSAQAEERRQADAHVHGKGELNIAVEGSKVSLELRSPGVDIVGFEHEAKTDADKKAVADANATLKALTEVIEIPAAAGCKIESAFSHYTKDPDHAKMHAEHAKHEGHGHSDHGHDKHKHGDHDHGHSHGHHDHGHKAKKAKAKDGHGHDHGHSHDHGHHHDHEDGHAEFHAGWKLDCKAADKLSPMKFGYFARFAKAESLTVNVVTASAQKSYTVSRSSPSLTLN